MDVPICYELRVISIAIGSTVKCYNPKSFNSFKASLELSFSTPTCYKDCSRFLFGTTHAIFSLACLFAGYVAY